MEKSWKLHGIGVSQSSGNSHFEWPSDCLHIHELACTFVARWEWREGEKYIEFNIWTLYQEDKWIGLHFGHNNVKDEIFDQF